jgi:hypothetical protein
MAKRSKNPPEQRPDIFERFGNELAKGGGIDRLLIFGEPVAGELDIDPRVQKWLVAIDEAEAGDKSGLVALLKSGSLPNIIVPHIGDLIERWDWVRPKHRSRQPSHRMIAVDIAMNAACAELDELLAVGNPIRDAIVVVARSHGIKQTVLREYHTKRRGPKRRVQARAYDAKRRAKRRGADK